jgi:N-formylglutamate deformylase
MDLPLPFTLTPAHSDIVSAPSGDESPWAAPLAIVRPARQTAPLVFASPHSGRDYSAPFLAAARLDATALRRSEDCYVDEIFAAAPALGAPLLAACFPRAWCDANREAWELDPAMFEDGLPAWVNTTSARVGAGLGTIARVVASGETIYRDKLRFAEAEARVRHCWQPFHDALAALIEATRRQFGRCLLIDCHSMPEAGAAAADGRGGGADVVLGDAHGTACHAHTIRRAEQALEALGYRVRRNDPYAGGYITRHYGRPREGMEALQIELCRSLYMDQSRFQKRPGFAALQRDMAALIATLIAG